MLKTSTINVQLPREPGPIPVPDMHCPSIARERSGSVTGSPLRGNSTTSVCYHTQWGTVQQGQWGTVQHGQWGRRRGRSHNKSSLPLKVLPREKQRGGGEEVGVKGSRREPDGVREGKKREVEFRVSAR